MDSKNVFVIGCGRWGTFIGWYLNSIGHNVTIYGRENSQRFQSLREKSGNEYLSLPAEICLSCNLEDALKADIIVISVNAQNLRDVVDELNALGLKDKSLVLCMKGVEIATGCRLSEVISQVLDDSNSCAVWLGPGHVQEFMRGVPNCMVIDSDDEDLKKALIEDFSGPLIRFYYGTDLIGNEIGGAAKNVVGIAAGMLEGLDKASLKGALMARGTKEVADLILAMGGSASSAYGLCHLGDYEATLFSPHSQNLAFGRSVVKGESYGKLAEGYYTVKALCSLADRYNVEMPIARCIKAVLYEDKNAEYMLNTLFARSLKNEFN